MKRPRRGKTYLDEELDERPDFSVGAYQTTETKPGKSKIAQIGFIREKVKRQVQPKRKK